MIRRFIRNATLGMYVAMAGFGCGSPTDSGNEDPIYVDTNSGDVDFDTSSDSGADYDFGRPDLGDVVDADSGRDTEVIDTRVDVPDLADAVDSSDIYETGDVGRDIEVSDTRVDAPDLTDTLRDSDIYETGDVGRDIEVSDTRVDVPDLADAVDSSDIYETGDVPCVDLDEDDICDDIDDCVGTYDALGVCGGDCLEDLDGDGVCDVDEIPGCTTLDACNYNVLATDDDGSCEFAQTWHVDVDVDGHGDPDDYITNCIAVDRFIIPLSSGLVNDCYDSPVEGPDGVLATPDDALWTFPGAQDFYFLDEDGNVTNEVTFLGPYPSGVNRSCNEDGQIDVGTRLPVSSGRGWMGFSEDVNPPGSDGGDNNPFHQVELTYDFSVGRFEITNWEMYQCNLAGFCSHPGNSDPEEREKPATTVTLRQLIEVCNYQGGTGSIVGRPLTEAEWERTARGGWDAPSDGNARTYTWGEAAPDTTLANFGNAFDGIVSVGQFSPDGDGPYGHADLAGNVQELTLDLFLSGAYGGGAMRTNPFVTVGELVVTRGGHFASSTDRLYEISTIIRGPLLVSLGSSNIATGGRCVFVELGGDGDYDITHLIEE